MFLTEQKLQARIHDLAYLRYRDIRMVEDWFLKEDEDGANGTRPAPIIEGKPVQIGERWQGRDRYCWFSRHIEIPESWFDRTVIGYFDFGRSGGGNNSGFESLLYIEGEPYQGVDMNHQEVIFPKDAAGKTYRLQFRLWSGLEGGGQPRLQEYQFAAAKIGWLDGACDDLYYTAIAALQTIDWLDKNDERRVSLLHELNQAFLLVDWAQPGSSRFYDSIERARDALALSLAKMQKHEAVIAHCIGHTHIDVAWLWRLKHTREKAARSFSTVLRLMELYPEYVFLQTQPQLYEYLKMDYPDMYEKVKEKIEEKRWEADGAMWLEADCNLTSGESLVRQILYGTQFFKKEFGVSCKYLWLPDVFGYSWALPQILKKSNIDTFMTTKISWNTYNRMPHDTFMWRGIDGSSVMAHFITTPDPGSRSGWFYTYNGQITADTIAGAWKGYQDKEINRELLVAYGFGDGGGGVNRDMLEMIRRLDVMPGIPHVQPGRADEYFEGLQERIEKTKGYVHTWDGELYLEYHRGTYTSQAYNKRMNRKLELAYRETEWLSVMAGGSFAKSVQPALYEGWKIVLRNQFHDIIPGSSIHEVYEDSRKEYEEAQDIVKGTWHQTVQQLLEPKSDEYTVINSASFDRTGIAIIDRQSQQPVRFVDEENRSLPHQIIDGRDYIVVHQIPAMGMKSIRALSDQGLTNLIENDACAPFVIKEKGLRTPFYELAWNDSGQLVRIYDRVKQREVLPEGEKANVFLVYEDKPLAHDAWDIDMFYQEKRQEIQQCENIEIRALGEVCAIVRFSYRYASSTITQDLIVYANSLRIDFKTNVSWHEHQQLLKVVFPVDLRFTEATYDIQFGNVTRPTHWNTSWDQARFESVGHQWADVSEAGYGVALLNDCKYGYNIKDHVLGLSLIKSSVYPDPQADQGDHEFTYSLLMHEGNWRDGRVVQEAWDLNSPLRVEPGLRSHGIDRLCKLSTDAVMIDAVKSAEDLDCIVLRFHEFKGARHALEVEIIPNVTQWCLANLLEQPVGPWQSGPISMTIKPYEIITLLVDIE